jgi:hypothetical protein
MRISDHLFLVLPATKPGKACVIYPWGRFEDGLGKFGLIISIGQVQNGQIITDNNEILFLEGPYLAKLAVDQNNNPTAEFYPPAYSYHPDQQVDPKELAEVEVQLKGMNRALERRGCTMNKPT